MVYGIRRLNMTVSFLPGQLQLFTITFFTVVPVPSIIIAHEFYDALPVHQFQVRMVFSNLCLQNGHSLHIFLFLSHLLIFHCRGLLVTGVRKWWMFQKIQSKDVTLCPIELVFLREMGYKIVINIV